MGRHDEKIPDEVVRSVEVQKSALRLEDTLPEADGCAACIEARAASKDPTDLCAEHLRKIYGL